jgi:hypothetical protein
MTDRKRTIVLGGLLALTGGARLGLASSRAASSTAARPKSGRKSLPEQATHGR